MDGTDDGRRLGAHLVLTRPIGRGASGEVWEAVDQRTGEHVAAKVLRPELSGDHDVVTGFLAERGLLVGLRHPSIVAVRDLVAEDGRLAIVMDLLDGGSLRDVLLQRGTLPPSLVAGVVAQVLDALAFAQSQGVQHRDVKPDNVLLTATWEALRPGGVQLADFGVARLLERNRHLTTGILGTPEYMAPELVATGRSGFPADVYAAGVLAYELLAGRTPFAGPGNDFTVAHRQVNAEPPRLRVPGVLWRLIDAMLAKDPARRPTAASAAARLRQMAGQLEGVAALPTQAPVDDFQASDHPATLLRGQGTMPGTSLPEDPDAHAVRDAAEASEEPPDLPDLGAADGHTILRPMPVRSATTAPRPDPTPTPWWRRPAVWVPAVLALVAAVVAAVVLWPRHGAPAASPSPSGERVAPVVQTDQPLPTGLGVTREATLDEGTHVVSLSITYSAQRAPLAGPFLEVVPGAQGCPSPTWSGATVSRNLPTVTGISVDCGWAVDVTVPANGQVHVQASVPVAQDVTASTLDRWLEAESTATRDALADKQVTGSAYPVQRLRSVAVVTPSRVVTGDTVRVDLVPQWPSGADPVSPLFRSPGMGDATTVLKAVAGGLGGVRLSDGCGSLYVEKGLTVMAQTMTTACTVEASVGNFTDLSSSSFAIATRGR